jgi:hypothetical protein
MSCVLSVEDPAKLNVTVTPGFAASKFFPISLNASVREAAAKTVKVRGWGTSVGGTGVMVGGTAVGGTAVEGTAVGTAGIGVATGPQAASKAAIKRMASPKRFMIFFSFRIY